MLNLLLSPLLLFLCSASPFNAQAQYAAFANKRPPGNYFSGRFEYRTGFMNQSASFRELSQPILLLSLTDLGYIGSFMFKLDRSLHKTPPNIMTLWANATVLGLSSRTLIYRLSVSYVVTNPLTTTELFYANLTSSRMQPIFQSKHPHSQQLRHQYFLVGFSSNQLTTSVRIQSSRTANLPNSYTVLTLDEFRIQDWVEVLLIVVYYGDQQKCERGSLEFKQVMVAMPGESQNRNITTFRPGLLYFVGLSEVSAPESNFTYVEPIFTVTNRSLIRYSLLGANMTCTNEIKVALLEGTKEESKQLKNEGGRMRIMECMVVMVMLVDGNRRR